MTGDRHDSETELAAQGVATIAPACFMGLPVTGGIAGFIFLLIRKLAHPQEELEIMYVEERVSEIVLALAGHPHFGRTAEPRASEARLQRGH